MKSTSEIKTLQTIILVVASALYLSCISTSAFALTKEELLAYSNDVNNIVEENTLQLEPGSLKKMSQEEKQKKTVDLMKVVGANDANWRDTLSYYSDLFRRCAERLSNEVTIRDPDLVAWNKKLISGYEDSHKVTELALSLLITPDMAGLERALANADLQKRSRDNQVYHHSIQGELDNIIKSSFPTDRAVQNLSRRLAGLYVETTWK
jgi:hypothetical protein